jgi:hypothetical protein
MILKEYISQDNNLDILVLQTYQSPDDENQNGSRNISFFEAT